LDMAWQFFRGRRRKLGMTFCQTAYEWFLDEAVASGRINAPGYFESRAIRAAYSGAQWVGPGRPTVDALKDAQADREYLDMRIISREEIRAERYGDRGTWEQLLPQLEREQAMIGDAGLSSGQDAQGSAQGSAAEAEQEDGTEDSSGYSP
ncbi:MAG TPA: hypothetical protein VFF88_06535, partial [Methylocella sp.]|nr:hypothetical protein [Methylocella sp.]